MLTCRPLGLAASALAVAVITHAALGNGAVLHKSGPIQITADGQQVWVVNPDHDSVSRLQTATEIVDQFPLPDIGEAHEPRGLALLADGSEVWVACHDSNRVYVLDAAGGGVLEAHVLHHGSGPIAVAVSPDGAQALVALHRMGAIAVFDTASRQLVTIIEGLFRRPFGITYTSDPEQAQNQAWVTHTVTDGEDSHVTAIDTSALSVSARVILKSVNPKTVAQISGDPDPIPEGGYLLVHGHPAQPPGTDHVWLPVQYQNFHNDQFTPHSSVQAAIHKIDLPSQTHLGNGSSDRVVLTAVYAHANTTLQGPGWNASIAGPRDLAFSADGATAYLASNYSDDVIVFPTDIGMVKPGGADPLPEIAVGSHPIGLVASPVADRVYVLNHLSRDVSVIDTAGRSELARIDVTPGTPEPLDARLLAGAKLFNTTTDPRISAGGKVACASCHVGGQGDGLLWGFTQFGAGNRKTFSLLGLNLSFGPPMGGFGQLHRGGDRDEVQDFEHTFRGATMGGTGFLGSPNPDLGPPNAGLDPDLDAVAAYVLGLPPLTKSPHRGAGGSLGAAAVRGGAIFASTSGPLAVGCTDCHPGPSFTDLDFHDVGGLAPPPELQGPAFNTPTLVGAWDDGPHVQTVAWVDGSTLGGVVRAAQSGGHGDTSVLNRTQRRDLEAFLNSIDGQMAETGIAGIADTDPPRVVAVRPVSLSAVEVIFDETVDPLTAGDPANYVLTDGAGDYPATSAVVNPEWGNRVRLGVDLDWFGCAATYTLLPGPIRDVAGLTGPMSNTLDGADPGNQKSFTIDGAITVAFGDGGDETFPGVARDAGFSAGLGNVSFARWWLYPYTSPEMKGFIRFDFVPALVNECGVSDSGQIADARFTHQPVLGHRNTLELHRCLMPWGDPPHDWCFSCPGAVTRQHAMHNSVPWHQSGANAYGGAGSSPGEYHPGGAFDVAAAVDGTAEVEAINQRVEFAGPLVTDAFRFWFDNPSINFGYMVEVSGNDGTGTEFHGSQQEDGRFGAVLSITFDVAETPGALDCDNDGTADPCQIAADPGLDQDQDGLLDACEEAGDVNGDGMVDVDDLTTVVLNWGACPAPPAPCVGDANHDGVVDVDDLVVVVLGWS